MEMTLKEIAEALGADLVIPKTPKRRQPSKVALCTDSRAFRKGQVFWALRGENFDGHRFVAEAFEKGGIAAVVEKNWQELNGNPVHVYVPVGDTRKALLTLGKAYAAKFKIPKIAVTGSNGKTTTKEMIAAILRQVGPTLVTQGNLNNDIGVPLTLFELKSNHKFAVVEMGTNHPGEIKPLSDAAAPTISVITNIGDSHLEHFGSREKVLEEKLTVASGLGDRGVLVLNVDDPLLANVKASSKVKLLTFGIHRGQIRAQDVVLGEDGCARFKLGRTAFRLAVPGMHMVYNALAAIAVGVQLRIPKSVMAEALSRFAGAKNRMQVKKLGPVVLLDDCYNANPSSMRAALETLGNFQSASRRVAILGDMLELGDASQRLHSEIGRQIAEMGVDQLFTFGQMSRHINQAAREKGLAPRAAVHFSDFELLAGELAKSIRPGDVVLVKGSRGMKLERVGETLKVIVPQWMRARERG
jgi:UDP-N-acetylmuramoyl-tripeptide--D-alanyl-D-alanine ligase